jgi:hypothetical protein
MNHINDLFSKLKSSFAAHSHKKAAVIGVCLEKAKVNLEESQIEINGSYVKLSISSAAKSAIFMNKAAILEALKGRTKPEILDIR